VCEIIVFVLSIRSCSSNEDLMTKGCKIIYGGSMTLCCVSELKVSQVFATRTDKNAVRQDIVKTVKSETQLHDEAWTNRRVTLSYCVPLLAPEECDELGRFERRNVAVFVADNIVVEKVAQRTLPHFVRRKYNDICRINSSCVTKTAT
jgi:hypothetical protein